MSARSHTNAMSLSEVIIISRNKIPFAFTLVNKYLFDFVIQEVQRHSVHTLVFRSLKRTHDMFLSCQGMLPPIDEEALVDFLHFIKQ